MVIASFRHTRSNARISSLHPSTTIDNLQLYVASTVESFARVASSRALARPFDSGSLAPCAASVRRRQTADLPTPKSDRPAERNRSGSVQRQSTKSVGPPPFKDKESPFPALDGVPRGKALTRRERASATAWTRHSPFSCYLEFFSLRGEVQDGQSRWTSTPERSSCSSTGFACGKSRIIATRR